MRKVLLIDDEKWIRRGLIQSIPWDMGLELAGEAGDGDTGYALALELKPDLIFLDMRMPGLEGKELLGLFHRSLPGTLVIVVSGYSDFEYTKEAIRQGAFDYLLKPVKKEDLAAIVARAVEELDRRREERSLVERSLGTGWLRKALLRGRAAAGGPDRQHGGAAAGVIEVPDGWEGGEWVVLAAQPDRYRSTADGVGFGYGDGDGAAAAYSDAIRAQLDRLKPFIAGGGWSFELAPDEAARLMVAAVHGPKLGAEDTARIAAAIQSALQGAGPEGSSWSVGLSGVKTGPAGLPDGFREARLALQSKLLGESGVILTGGETGRGHPKVPYPQEREDSFLLSLQSGHPDAALAEFNQWLAAAGKHPVTVGQLQQRSVQLVHAIEKLLQAKESGLAELTGRDPLAYAEMLAARNDPDAIRSLFGELLIPPVAGYYAKLGEKQGEKIVEDLKKRIETQYTQPLSLHHIAAGYYMNADYLSRLFKKVTGTNFVDYLTEVRIAKSKELMKLTRYKNYEIAQLVGYEDYRYFSQIFKKKTGMTIKEYRSAEGLGE